MKCEKHANYFRARFSIQLIVEVIKMFLARSLLLKFQLYCSTFDNDPLSMISSMGVHSFRSCLCAPALLPWFPSRMNIDERIGIFHFVWSSSQWLFIQSSTSSTCGARNQFSLLSSSRLLTVIKLRLEHKANFYHLPSLFIFLQLFSNEFPLMMLKNISVCFSFFLSLKFWGFSNESIYTRDRFYVKRTPPGDVLTKKIRIFNFIVIFHLLLIWFSFLVLTSMLDARCSMLDGGVTVEGN